MKSLISIYSQKTEIERIKQSGLLPGSFFDEEERDGINVSRELKSIWAVELDLLNEFDRVCKKYNLRYYAFGGTLLGAVRHHGFIPWDDDIDVAMPMEDYKLIQEIAQKEFIHPYKLQTPYLDKGSYFSFMKLRNENTTFMSKVYSAQQFNQGAFIDIFPLVECPPDKVKEQRDKIFPSIMRCSNYMKRGCESMLNEQQMERYKVFYTDTPLAEYEKIITEFDNPDYRGCGYYTHASLFFNRDEYHVWKSSLWSDVIDWPFENMEVPIPFGWESIMEEYYGDYMQLPALEKRVSNHSDMIIDMENPYKLYIKQNSK